MSVLNMTAGELRRLLDAGELRSLEITEAILHRIRTTDPQVGAFITVTAEEAVATAEEADWALTRLRHHGQLGYGTAWASGRDEPSASRPLLGLPVSVKDNIWIAGVPATAASRALAGWLPPGDADVVRRLRQNLAPIVGKTNMDELAIGSTTELSAIKPTRHPLDLRRVPGGSSGGAAASVAAGMAVLALGSDTGGSVRTPAAWCGLVGMKPSFGRVSRYGLIPLGPSLEQIGPITLDVADCALALNVLCRYDPRDPESLPAPDLDFTRMLQPRTRGLRVGLPREYFEADLDADVRRVVMAAAERLESAGVSVREVSLPHTRHALEAYGVIVAAEAVSALAEVGEDEARRSLLGPEVKRRLAFGAYLRTEQGYDRYRRARSVRTLLRSEFDRVFQTVDVLLTPVSPTTAPLSSDASPDGRPQHKPNFFTVPANLASLPALAMPVGVDSEGMPVGAQIVGPYLGDAAVVQAAYTLEQLLQPAGEKRPLWRRLRENAREGVWGKSSQSLDHPGNSVV